MARSTEFIGLGAGSVCLRDMGYIFIARGGRLFRMDEAKFDNLIESRGSGQAVVIPAEYVDLFTYYPTRALALASYEDHFDTP
jgi:hypothetical protein